MLSILLAATLSTAQPAAALPPPDADEQEVTVQAKRLKRQAVSSFVKSLSLPSDNLPLARFSETICPRAVGLTPALDLAITRRMRRVAAGGGIAVAPSENCRPNALVMFADDKAEMMRAFRRRYPVWFEDAVGQAAEIPNEKGPAIAWHNVGRRDRSGQAVAWNAEERRYELVSPIVASRTSISMRPVFVAAVVIIERRALEGLSATQVADYAAMRAFTGAQPSRAAAGGAPTILGVLDSAPDSENPASLTAWDLGFLKGLYMVQPYARANAQQATIREEVTRELEKPRE
ncbi:hypothetical protein GCM10022280_01780 [Sphingomonas swuensis]|uniref:DUF2927 domain-containing protein n=1 Tax=Sphingomonas swuensis TaxID=977800 RepID=A0ABP7SA48_9SPHN